jgi:fatty-acyl-CoA synthase
MQFRGMTISDQLARHARRSPDALAFTFEGTTRTYAEVDRRVSRLAAALRDRGVGSGDRVAILALNGLEYVETVLGVARLGAISVPINFRYVDAEARYVLSDSGARAVVVGAPLEALAAAASADTEVGTVLSWGAVSDGAVSYEDAIAAATPASEWPEVPDGDAAFIMYTSGTTGRPKGAVLTHRNLLMHATSYLAQFGVPPDDRTWLAGSPLFHIAGVSSLISYLYLGGRTVLTPSGQFDARRMVELMAGEKVSACFFVPAQWQLICELDLASYDLSALRRIVWGAAPASTTLIRKMIDSFPQAEVVTVFGQKECSPVTSDLRGEDALRKIGSVGTPMLNVETRIVDDAMHDVPVGEVGEIVYRGPTVMSEYWRKPAETGDAFEGGWFHSGDLVRSDDEGFLWVVDRKKDMIISGGENIYCAEVENALAAHPGIADVSIIGVPDDRWGEIPLAVLVPRDPSAPPTADDLDEFCRTRLAGYKRPRRVEFVDELPRNAGGKVLKRALREKYAPLP